AAELTFGLPTVFRAPEDWQAEMKGEVFDLVQCSQRIYTGDAAKTSQASQVMYWSGLIGGLATMEVLMLQGAKQFTPYVTCEFKRAYCVFRSALNILADRAIAQGEAKYHMRPK
ncbi:unnamed protein product, partial [Cladocopium goreaui]